MVWKMLHEIPESDAKDMAKMDIKRQLIQLKHARPTQAAMMYPENQQPQNYDNPFNFRGTSCPALDSHTRSRAQQNFFWNLYKRGAPNNLSQYWIEVKLILK
eukprot:gene5014-5669_t